MWVIIKEKSTIKEKIIFSSFQWKNALPSGAKVYWNNITCLCKEFIVVSITICIVMSLVVKMLFTPLHDTSEYISFQTFRKNVYVYFLLFVHIKLNSTTSIYFYAYIQPECHYERKLRRYKNKALSDLSGVDVESLARWKVWTKSL